MKKLFRYTGIGLLSILFIMVILLINIIWFKPFSINLFYQKVFAGIILDQPELISQLGLPVRYFNTKLNDVGPKDEEERFELYEKSQHTLMRYNYDRLNEQKKLSYDILNWFLVDLISGKFWQYHNYPVNQLTGIQSELPSFMDSFHRINDEKDARHYLIRLSKFPVKFSQVLEGLEKREDMGIIPPKFVIEKVLKEMQNFINGRVEENILYGSFKEKLKFSKIDSNRHESYLAEVKKEIEQSVFPAYGTFISYFEKLYPKATTDDGVWKFPDGDSFYQYLLKSNTQTNLPAEEIHQIGLKEVVRIQSEIMVILADLGYPAENSFRQLMTQLSLEERFLYPDVNDSYEQIIMDYQSIIGHTEEYLEKAFNRRPKAGVEVKRIPQFKEATSPLAYYYPPAADGSRKGVFYVNQRYLSEHIKFKMATLAYHEAVPGHHFQTALQQELKGVPSFRKFIPFTAYDEGWAMYAEQLAWELGFHKDPYSNLGRLESELFRAVRLVVDTGIHHKRWTRKEAIGYMVENTGLQLSDIEAEVERYIVMPGQACAYKMGMIEILRIRQKAMDALGDKFSLPEFHDVILGNGQMPIPLLEKEVDKYIGRKIQVKS
jgi:uncharacterized protein (DUF885 family)